MKIKLSTDSVSKKIEEERVNSTTVLKNIHVEEMCQHVG